MSSAACSATEEPSKFDDGSGATSGSGSGGAGGNGGAGSGGEVALGGNVGVGGTGSGGAPDEIAEVFGASAEKLFRLDPKTKAVTVVGDFSGGCYPVIDIALDKDSQMYATTYDSLYAVDKDTAVCTLIASLGYPNSLSFVPAGTVDPNVESLVGYNGSTYVRIDTTTGQMTNIGTLTSYVSSGDIVSVKGGKTLLTAKGDGCSVYDCLLEVDPTTGDLVKNWGPLPYVDVFGLAFWAGSAYGFAQSGELFEVTFNGNSITTTPIPIPNPPPNLYFWGAGSTTSAPPRPIPE